MFESWATIFRARNQVLEYELSLSNNHATRIHPRSRVGDVSQLPQSAEHLRRVQHDQICFDCYDHVCRFWRLLGAKIYQQLCLRCHGEKLDGRGPEAQYLKVMPADLQSTSSRTKSDWELLIIVAHGVMYTPMHGFRDVLTEQDIKDVLSFIRVEAPFRAVS